MTRTFTPDDQIAFARLSGDHNPIHIDPLAARRLLFGRPVVHGMHVALWAMDQWLNDRTEQIRITRLNVKFRAPVFVGEPVTWAMSEHQPPGQVRIDVHGRGMLLVSIELCAEPSTAAGAVISSRQFPEQPCRERSPAEVQSIAGQLPLALDPSLAARLLPNLTRKLPAGQLALLLCTTRLVGMEAPGLHSLYMGLDLEAGSNETPGHLVYQTQKFDARFSIVTLAIAGADLRGEISAAFRAAPTEQVSFASLQSQVRPDEFQGERALVIGGSRGLGEVAVKALAAGGVEVKFTYHRGIADAERIAGEIAGAGRSAEAFAHDVLGDGATLKEHLDPWHPTILCYFATPFISSGSARGFSDARFIDFCGYYVDGFLKSFRAARAGGELRKILYPSSAFIDDPSTAMAEYAAAKSAGERLCQFLAKSDPNIHFHVPRFPRLATDQTARRSFLPVKSEDPIEPIVKALREMARRG